MDLSHLSNCYSKDGMIEQSNILIWDISQFCIPTWLIWVKRNLRVSKTIYDESYRSLVDAVRAARIAGGVTQQQVADTLGKPQSFVAKVEGFERRLDVIEFLKFAKAAGCDPVPALQRTFNSL